MSRLLFEKTGNAVWISHLDLMRVFQRSFRRAGFLLKHTGGFNQHAYVSLALPLSVGTESHCEILEYELDDPASPEEVRERLNRALPGGVIVLQVYESTVKLGRLARLHCRVELEYDNGIPEEAEKAVRALFSRESVTIDKRTKRGTAEVDLIPMIFSLVISEKDPCTLLLDAVISAQNPSMNPTQFGTAIEKFIPEFRPDFLRCERLEVLAEDGTVFR